MSSIPPAGHAGLIQAQGAQRQASDVRAKENSSQAQRSGDTFSDRLKEVIENGDLDSQVYADGEGAGGQGKQHSEEQGQPDETLEAPDESASDGPHLDIEA